MINPAKQPSQFGRREALQTVGAAVVLAAASGARELTGGADAATPGFWPNGAWLAVSLSLTFEGGGQLVSGASEVTLDPIERSIPDRVQYRADQRRRRCGLRRRRPRATACPFA
jgi:hypothetical protein